MREIGLNVIATPPFYRFQSHLARGREFSFLICIHSIVCLEILQFFSPPALNVQKKNLQPRRERVEAEFHDQGILWHNGNLECRHELTSFARCSVGLPVNAIESSTIRILTWTSNRENGNGQEFFSPLLTFLFCFSALPGRSKLASRREQSRRDDDHYNLNLLAFSWLSVNCSHFFESVRVGISMSDDSATFWRR